MKKISASFFFLLAFNLCTNATEWTVQVSNFKFNPATLNVVVGDVVKWVWVSGTHTTTSSTIPAGAASWDSPITGTSTTFSYTVTVAGTYNYVCTPHEAFGMVASFTASPNLPVVLKGFSVSSTKANTALLQWSTVTEENADYFAVLRSTDGVNYEQITTIRAAGNSTQVNNYSYTDNTITNQNKYYYYSLKTVDKDGKYSVSSIELFKNAAAVSRLITKLSPNPVSRPAHLMLQFNADKKGNLLVQLYDASGKLVKQDNMQADPGLNNGHFHIGDVPAGNYTVVFVLDDVKETYSIVVQ